MRDKRKWADAGGSHVGVLLLSKTGIEGHVVFTFQSALKMANPFPSKKKKNNGQPIDIGPFHAQVTIYVFPRIGSCGFSVLSSLSLSLCLLVFVIAATNKVHHIFTCITTMIFPFCCFVLDRIRIWNYSL